MGTVFVAVAGPLGVGKVAALRLNGERTDIRRESVLHVLELLSGELAENAGAQDTEQNGGIDVCSPERTRHRSPHGRSAKRYGGA